MLMRVAIIRAAKQQDAAETMQSNQTAGALLLQMGVVVSSKKPPRLMIPACSNADTGVGASTT